MFEDSSYNNFQSNTIKKWFLPDMTEIISNDIKGLMPHNFRYKHIKEVQDTLKTISTSTKITKIHYKDLNFYSTECELVRSQNFYFNRMREAAKKIPITGLLLEWEECIYKLINKSQLRDKYTDIFEELMREIKKRYYEIMRDIAMRQIIAIKYEITYQEDLVPILPYKYPGRTEFYTKFLRNRCTFAKQYYLSHRFIRSIVVKADLLLPEKFCDLGRYRSFDFLDLDRLFDFIGADLKKSAHIVIASYYSDIIRLVSQRRYIQDVPSNILGRFVKCATSLLGLQIISRTINTIEHLLIILADQTKIPLLKFELRYENNDLFVNPRWEKLLYAFHDLINEIANIAQYLPPLQTWIRVKEKQKKEDVADINVAINDRIMFASLPSWYIDDVHRRLNMILKETFQPLDDYVQGLRLRFGNIIHEETETHRDVHAERKHSLEEYVIKVENYNELIQEINGMTDNEYLVMIKLYQVIAKRELIIQANKLRKLVIDKLVKRHWDYNLEICDTFEALKDRALDVPQTTRELLELGQYMLKATSVLMIELQDKISLSLRMMSSLIEMTSLSKHHVELNNTTVQWLKRIRPIFERSGAMYEQMKFELEENLQEQVVILNTHVEDMFPRLIIMDDMNDAKRIKEYIEDTRKLVHQLEHMEKKAESINAEESLFQFPLTLYPRINELKQNILPFYALIYRSYQWHRDRDVWLDGPFEYLDVDFIENKINQYLTDFSKTSKQFRTKIKMQIAMNYPYSFAGFIEDPDPFQQPAPLKLCHQLMEDIKWFKNYIPLLAIFRNPAMQQLHWDDMSAIAQFDLTPDAGTTFRKIINMDLMKDLEKYEIISGSATKEMANENLLKKMKSDWDEVFFNTVPYKETLVSILTQLDDILMMLDEHTIKVQAMRGSAFIKRIEHEVNSFYALLLRMHTAIDEWTKVQVQWIYLLPIFSSKDIVAQLPTEDILFIQIDALFRKTMQNVTKNPKVIDNAGAIGLMESMQEANKFLEQINAGVLDYLEKKRLFFPRFFFLSNDDMFEILSETKEPFRVQPHLKKCFEGINRLGFDEELQIYSMFSDDKEEVIMKEIISTIAARGCVERWLLQVETQMLRSIRDEVYLSYLDYEASERNIWILTWPGMVILCVSQIYWSLEVQNCLISRAAFALELLYEKLKSQIFKLVELVRGELSKQNRTTLNALITIDVHNMDVVKSLVEKQISDETDFEWLAQLRYYWEDDVYVRLIYSTIRYAYEYIGNTSRLVITPLTDRCYRTLIGAYSLHLNGAPEGPAGTGKTETTKDLSRAIAVQCVVFNCSDGLDYKNMGKFFKGLVCCGAWACFDEFNRIELEVLSVVAQQILCIIQAVRAALEIFLFEDTMLKLNPAVYVCITMNPGYAGRSELPDNLKVLFRTVAMMVPDYAMIAEIFLYSSGFGNARELAVKIVMTYKLCSEQLSSQSHYDYGMRAVKSVLSAAQNLKLKYPTEEEAILVLRSLIDVNLPKFLSRDMQLFQNIVTDLFPELELPSPDYDAFLAAMNDIAQKQNLQTVNVFVLKIIQTYEMMMVRHGFMLVGEPYGGKTAILRTLADTLKLMYEQGDEQGAMTKYFILNPKAITLGQLYGFIDPVSSEWTDGICSKAFRQFSLDDSSIRRWIIFDGPIDAVWIESLNTVLDDNKKLCLTSGEIVHMTDGMSMIFETMDLIYASPATVSRCGMIYIEPAAMGWKPFFESWLHTLDPIWITDHENEINELFCWLMDPCLDFIRKECHTNISIGQIHRVMSTMSIFQLLIDDAIQNNLKTFDQYILGWFQAGIIISMIWGAASTLDCESRDKFDAFYLSLWKGEYEEYPLPTIVISNPISMPGEGPIYDQYYSFRAKGIWKNFADTAKAERFIDTENIVHTIIPTIDTVKYQNIMQMHIKRQKRFLLYGDTGTGKSLYLKDLLTTKLSEDEYLPNLITFAPKITAAQVQELVILKLQKRRRNQFGPPIDKCCIVFIDEVNMPIKEIYGAQPAIELLRQFFDYGIWFDMKKVEEIVILDTMFVCAMGLPGGSRQEIYQRFLRHFNLFHICEFSRDSLFRIFTNLAFVGLKQNGFTAGVLPIVNDLVNATMNVFNTVIQHLRPTPHKPHYLFNIRDFMRVITGCALLRKESANSSRIIFSRLWVHEILRIFNDRLIDQSDRYWLFLTIKNTVEKILKERFDALFDHLPKFENEITENSLNSLIFGNFMDIEALPEDRRYEEIPSIQEYEQIANLFMEEYNDMHRDKIDIVLFRYALEHLARICRVMAIPCGSMLMIGTRGSGRQNLTRLSTAATGYNLFQPEISSIYGFNEWREDIKIILRNSGGIGKNLVFLLAEEQILDESFLDDINSLLNDGEVPNLFTIEERQEIIEMTRLAAQKGEKGLDISVFAVLAFFVNRCREKLHIMLCLSPIGDNFRTRLRMHPSLINCCTIDWFEEWPEDALEQVAQHSIGDVELTEVIKSESVIACKYFHICARDVSARFYELTGRKTYITTAAFLELVRTFSILIMEKRQELSQSRERYLNGLDRLEFAAGEIAQMQIELTKLKPQLEISAKETADTMQKIEAENEIIKRATVLVKKEEKIANVQAEIAMQLKTECEADLAKALPALEEATAALDILKPADIAVVKTMKSPPEVIKLVLAAVCVMMNIPPIKVDDPKTGGKILDYWTPSKRLLGDIKFLDSLRQYDKDNIPDHIIQEIKKNYIPNPNFDPKVVARASQAAEGLCKWIRAMVSYDGVIKIVAPKKAKLEASERELQNTLMFLEERRQMLTELNEKLDILRKNLSETTARMIYLENEVTSCRNKVIRAEKLISGLGGEKDRWTLAAERFRQLIETLPGDILISCGVIAYLGPFSTDFRTESLNKWQIHVKHSNIPSSEVYNFLEVLGTEIKINSWNIFGLPRDAFSIENAIIMDNSRRWSLFIDPQGQTNKWIRNMEKINELEIVRLSERNYMNVIERAIEYGKPVLVENVMEEIDPALDPILIRKTYMSAGRLYITLGEKSIEYNPRFKLYITTKLRNPHYQPEVFNKLTIISSALTLEALNEQLLNILVAKEQPRLEEKREYLIIQTALNSKALKEAEDNILYILATSGADILEDEEAIQILDSSKLLSIDIERKQAAAKKTAIQIDELRQCYQSIAKHSATLYYTITDLSAINPMYQYSLAWFINLYIMSIDTAGKSKNLERRLYFLRDTFTYNLYQNISRSLFEKDKILYAFILYTIILLTSSDITEEEMSFFISGDITMTEAAIQNPASDWLPQISWNEISKIATILPEFSDFMQSFQENLPLWKKYYDLLDPIDSPLPQPWDTILTPFQKLIVSRMIRPDTVPIMVQRFVEAGMGLRYVIPPPFNISKSYADSNCLTPLTFILSPGSDPMSALISFVENMNYLERFESISLGQGQGPIAQKMIQQAQTEGSWVCLQNCHLLASWMPYLENIYDNFDHTNTMPNFRLWLTSYPSNQFPVSILQNSIKMTNEPPMGLQNNIMRSYAAEAGRELESLQKDPTKMRIFSRLLYALCFFHAVIQERRNYGPQGWNVRYDFNESDLQISTQQLKHAVENYVTVAFDAITYLIGECNYGGKVTDERDRRCLMTILMDFCNLEIIENLNYSFSGIDSEYSMPKKHGYEDYIMQIQLIPLNPSPEIFGLHVNAAITRNFELTKNLFDSMALIRGTVVVDDILKQEQILLDMKKDIYEKIPELFDVEEARNRYPIEYMESINTVLIQEMERYNDLLIEIKNSLSTLEKAVKGLVIMTPVIEDLASSMLKAKIPPSWITACAYPSLKRLPNFIDDLLKRLNFLENWLHYGKPPTFWISGFSFPHAFLTAVAQNYARKYKIPIDKIGFDFEVLPMYESDESVIDGAYIYGMYLFGARWDMQQMLLAESYLKVLWDLLPIVWIKPCQVTLIFIGDRYECPLYITTARFGVLKTTGHSSNYVLSIFLDTDCSVKHWIKRGLALICQLDD